MSQRKDVHFGTLTFASLQTDQLDIPKGLPIVGLNLHLDGEINVTDVTAVSLSDEGLLNLITSIIVRADGVDLQKWTGRSLYAYNYFMNQGLPNTFRNTGITVAVQPIDLHLYLPFEFVPRWLTGQPGITYMDASRFDKFELEIGFGTSDASVDVFTTLTAGTIQNLTIRVDGVVLNEQAKNLGLPLKMIRTVPIVHLPSAANENEPIPLARPGETAFVMGRVSDAATSHILSDTLCNAVGIRQGPDFFIIQKKTYDFHRAQQKQFFQLNADYPFGTPIAPGDQIEGHFCFSMLEQGQQDAFSPGPINTFDVEVDTDAAARYDLQQIRLTKAL